MIQGWLLLLVSLLYVGLLFVVAWAGDRRPLYPRQPRLRPIVYSLALAVYCSSWTFYGAVGTAARVAVVESVIGVPSRCRPRQPARRPTPPRRDGR